MCTRSLFLLFIPLLVATSPSKATPPIFQSAITCALLYDILITYADADVRPYCLESERKCRALTMLKERPPTDTLRQSMETQLSSDTQYELSICEIALRKRDPEYLKQKKQR